MQNKGLGIFNETQTEVPTGTITESAPGGSEKENEEETDTSKKEERLRTKIAERVKTRVKNYFRNLDPRGKDKFWWTGNLLSTATGVFLYAAAPAYAPLKTIASISASLGVYAVEKGIEKFQKKRLSEEEFAERAARKQEKHPDGTSRIKKFLLGVAAGGIYGGILGHIETLGAISHPIKHFERRAAAFGRREVHRV